MRSGWRRFRQFLTAEEVPRWFGLSLVLIYLVGIGSVAQFAIEQARREGALQFHQTSRYAAKALAERMGYIIADSNSAQQQTGLLQRTLRELHAQLPTRWVRLVDRHRNVIASSNIAEIGRPAPPIPAQPSFPAVIETIAISVPRQKEPDVLLRVRVPQRATPSDNATGQASAGAEPTPQATLTSAAPYCLELRLPPEPIGPSSTANHARVLAIVLIVLGALFVVYRCLREQLRGVSRIASRLRLHSDRLVDDLDALRVADTSEDPSNVTAAWNELIDTTKDLREAQRRVQANEELSRALRHSGGGALAGALNAIPDAFLFIRDGDRIEYANTTAGRLFGLNLNDREQLSLSEVQAPGVVGRIMSTLHEAHRSDGTFDTCNTVVESNESETDDAGSYRVRIFPLKKGESEGACVMLVSDVSQQMRADRVREEFMIQVTHELRTPLTNIRAYTETLSSGMFDDPKVITECYNVITKETRRLARLIEDMLSVSQFEVGSMQLSLERVDLAALLDDSVRNMRGLADEKNIDLQLVLPAKMEPIEGDRDKLAVVINNLLGNALKYTAAGGDVVAGCQWAAHEVVITVKDNGVGIDPADHARIFEKFERADDPDVQSEPGNGIGLYTAREIVRKHRGRLELISKKGQGATFLVRLPHGESRAVAVAAEEEEVQRGG